MRGYGVELTYYGDGIMVTLPLPLKRTSFNTDFIILLYRGFGTGNKYDLPIGFCFEAELFDN